MEELGPKIKSVVRFVIVVFILTLVITIVCLLMLKYSVEGEDNMPFELSQLVIISTAEGLENDKNENTWNFNMVQNNDIYINISKNKNYTDTEIIKKITLNNFKIEDGPNIGEMTIYRPSEAEGTIYEYNEEYIINNEIIYEGSEATNEKNLEISNQGGVIIFRICNNKLRRIFIR